MREVCDPSGASSAHLNAGRWEGGYECRLLPLEMPALPPISATAYSKAAAGGLGRGNGGTGRSEDCLPWFCHLS